MFTASEQQVEGTSTATRSPDALLDAIMSWKRKRHAVLLAHNYQIGAIQDIADFVGDSLGLARQAAKTDAAVIVVCGVHFMAETAAIICPQKTVLLPDREAGCSLAEAITVEQLRAWKAEHPGAVVVSYINTTAAIKAESDYCCTSGNAVQIIEAIPPDREILFLPDRFLGHYVARVTGRAMHIWPGECHVHAAITAETIEKVKQSHPEAELMVHPECGCVTSCLDVLVEVPQGGERMSPGAHRDGARCCPNNGHGRNGQRVHILSTEGMIRHVQQSRARSFVVATETGVLHRMRKAVPDRTFYPVSEESVCRHMKKITLESVLHALQTMQYPITVEPEVAERAYQAIARMLEIG